MATFLALQTELAARLSTSVGATTPWTDAQRKRFINGAIRNANEAGAYRIVVDTTTLDVTADTVEYSLPSAITRANQLWRVSMQTDTDGDENYQDLDSWWVTETRSYAAGVDTPSLKLQFPFSLNGTAGNAIKLEYLAAHQELSANTDTTSIPEEYIYAYATFLAYSETRAFADEDRKWYTSESPKYFQLADRYLKRYINQLPRVEGRVVPQVWSIGY